MKQLKQFLIEANKAGYASGIDPRKEKDGSSTITYKSGDWSMNDNFFGGEPYGGRELVFRKGKPYWIMVYYGAVEKGVDKNKVYKFLQQSLKKMPKDAPFRGPKMYKNGNWKYENSWEGEVESFKGREEISKDGKKVYWAEYLGGLVDQN